MTKERGKEDERLTKEAEGIGLNFMYGLSQLERHGVMVTSLKIKYPLVDALMILTAKRNGRHVVAFIGGKDIAAIMKRFGQDAYAEEIDWDNDKYRND